MLNAGTSPYNQCRMSIETAAFVATVGGFVIGMSALIFRDIVRSPEARERWRGKFLAIPKWVYIGVFFFIVLGFTLSIAFRQQ